MLVVLLILGLVAGLVISRGPPHSAALDLRASAGEVAEALRLTRTQAIASGQPSTFVLDLAAHSYRPGHSAPHALSPRLTLSMTTVAGEAGRQIGGIVFEPDGSSSGGRVELAEGARHTQIGVDWLTGKVSIGDGR